MQASLDTGRIPNFVCKIKDIAVSTGCCTYIHTRILICIYLFLCLSLSLSPSLPLSLSLSLPLSPSPPLSQVSNNYAAPVDESLLVAGMGHGEAGPGAGPGAGLGAGMTSTDMGSVMGSADRARFDQEAAYLEDQNRIRSNAAQGTIKFY